MKKIMFLMMILSSTVSSFSVTPRQIDNIYSMEIKDKKDFDVVPYGKVKYIKTNTYENGYMNLYRITETDGNNKIITGFYVYLKGSESESYLVIPIYENVYSEEFKYYQKKAKIKSDEMSLILIEVTNQLLQENRLKSNY